MKANRPFRPGPPAFPNALAEPPLPPVCLDEHALASTRMTHARHMKLGPTRRYWTEFVFEAYVNHRPEAILLAGLPDVAASRPHSAAYDQQAWPWEKRG